MSTDLYCNPLAFQANRIAGVDVKLGDRVILFRPASGITQLVLTTPPILRSVEQLTAETAHLGTEHARFVHGHPVFGHVADIVREIFRTERQLASVRGDKRLTPEGMKERRLEIIQQAALPIAMATSNVHIQRYAADVKRRQDELYTVPRPADAIEAIADREARDLFRGLDPIAQRQLLASLQPSNFAGQVVPALMRSPAPLGLSEEMQQVLAQAWITRIDAEKPQQAERVRAESANARWAVDAAQACAAYCQATSLVGDKRTIFKAVRDIAGGPELFGFTEQEIQYHMAATSAA